MYTCACVCVCVHVCVHVYMCNVLVGTCVYRCMYLCFNVFEDRLKSETSVRTYLCACICVVCMLNIRLDCVCTYWRWLYNNVHVHLVYSNLQVMSPVNNVLIRSYRGAYSVKQFVVDVFLVIRVG